MWQIIPAGILIYIFIIFSVYEMYYQSKFIPINITYGTTSISPPSKRVLLIVFDQLDADIVNNEQQRFGIARFLRSITHKNLSHLIPVNIMHNMLGVEIPVHVPALFSGVEENPFYLVLHRNNKKFDTIIANSNFSQSIGARSTLKSFKRDVRHSNLEADPPDFFKYMNKDISMEYNHYVLNKYRMNNYHNFHTVNKNQSGIFQFMEFKTSKTVKTLSDESYNVTDYEEFILHLDHILAHLNDYVEWIFGKDNFTTFILTSYDTITYRKSIINTAPLLMWGAGVNTLFNLSNYHVRQIDIPVLISRLLGVPIPKQSTGSLPLGLINHNIPYLAESILLNAKQLYELFKTRENIKINYFRYVPYKKLRNNVVNTTFGEIQSYMKNENYNDTILVSLNFINEILKGINYVTSFYDCKYYLLCVTILCIWSLILLTTILKSEFPSIDIIEDRFNMPQLQNLFRLIITILGLTICVTITFLHTVAVSNMPWRYFLFFLLPEVLCIYFFYECHILFNVATRMSVFTISRILKVEAMMVMYFLYVMLLTFTMHMRTLLSIAIILFGVWTSFSTMPSVVPRKIYYGWIFSTISLSLFPMFNSISKEIENYQANVLLIAGNLLWMIAYVTNFFEYFLDGKYKFGLNKSKLRGDKKCYENMLYKLQFAYLAFASIASWINPALINAQHQSAIMVLAWYSTAVSILLIFMSSIDINSRIVFIATALAVPYLMFAVAYEGIFYFVFVLNILIWLQIEKFDEKYERIEYACFDLGLNRNNITFEILDALWVLPEYFVTSTIPLNQNANEFVRPRDVRRAVSFLHYIFVGFFSLTSVDTMREYSRLWLRIFLVFTETSKQWSPMIICLLTIKYLIPILFVFVIIRTIIFQTNTSVYRIFSIFLIIINLLILKLMFDVMAEDDRLHYTIADAKIFTILFFTVCSSIIFVPILYLIVFIFTSFQLK